MNLDLTSIITLQHRPTTFHSNDPVSKNVRLRTSNSRVDG
jgi:hypothetical protein